MTPNDLWNMTYDDFNKWRRENDLLKLFAFFESHLPNFNEWLAESQLSVDYILQTNKPGNFFYWDVPVYLVEYVDDNRGTQFMFIPIENKIHENQIEKRVAQKKDNWKVLRFTPYLRWAKTKLGTEKIIDANHAGKLETFRYTVRSAPDVPEVCSATLVSGFTVLKLGGVSIESWAKLNERNLDFTNLDHLTVTTDFHWSREIEIFYSSCENVTLNNAQPHFTKFYQCEFANLKTNNAVLYGIEFFHCDFYNAEFKDSKIRNVTFDQSNLSGLVFNNVEVEDLEYYPPKNQYGYGGNGSFDKFADNFKRFRVLFQSNGLRKEASDAYYNERYFEMLHSWNKSELSQSLQFTWKKNRIYAYQHFKMHSSLLLKSISGLISYLVWGFGERPFRVFLFSICTILLFSLIYFFSSVEELNGNVIDSIYLSIILFSTLGFGDYTPIQAGSFKLVLAFESLLGAFFLGLFVAGYANKSRY
jgi:hypothetical protein